VLLFEASANIITLSDADLYGGKLCAALDRQHPRDIFDVKILMENEGITNDIRTAFIVYVASHHRPMSELLNPNLKDFQPLFEQDFAGMADGEVEYIELVAMRDRLIETIRVTLTESEKNFLLSIKQGRPECGMGTFSNGWYRTIARDSMETHEYPENELKQKGGIATKTSGSIGMLTR